MAGDIIDAEILPDETAAGAVDRVTKLAIATVDTLSTGISLAVPTGNASTLLTREQADIIYAAPDELLIGFYNRSGKVPTLDDFAPAANWGDDVRAEMGLPPKAKALTTSSGFALMKAPFRRKELVGVAKIDRTGRGTARAGQTAYVTHAVIATKRDGIIAAAELPQPIKILQGHLLTIGVATVHNDFRERIRGDIRKLLGE
jgi:hypothetical protein